VVILAVSAAMPAHSQVAKKRVQERIEELIKKAMAEQEKKPGTNAPSPLQSIYNDIERQYLGGELTARQFMLINQELELYARTNLDARALSILPQQLRARFSTEGAAAGTNAPNAEEAAFTDIEKKIDELMVRNAQLQKSAATNAPSAAEPKTKREKLDHLLRLFINEKLTKQEYEAQRAKILAEPEVPVKH
jgi:hypothetical protein